MITIVDYGLGNIGAFLNMYKRMNIPAVAASDPAVLEEADHIILPGVGAFDHAMELLDASGMRPVLERKVTVEKVPVVGICVGMQILANSSEEGQGAGLGWIPGRVRRFQSNELPLPHMGWNDVIPRAGEPLFAGTEEAWRFYFLHSYYFECDDPANVVATANYGGDFSCVVRRGNVWGVQCHPEKSHHFGGALLRNFSTL